MNPVPDVSPGAHTKGRDDAALVRMPFDHYGRYRLAADVVQAVCAETAVRVLDVGGGPGSLKRFLPTAEVVATDVTVPGAWHVAASSLVVADGVALPFADDAFDVVVTLDTLEHVRPERRGALLREVVRTARGWALVVCPCATEGVAEADTALLEIVRRRFGDAFPTVTILEEHLAFGHPDPDAVAGTLRAAGAEVARIPSGRIDRWLPMMVAFFDLLQMGDDAPVEAVQAWYNRLYYRDDLRAPAYRQAFLCRLPGAGGPALDQVTAALLPEDPPEPAASDGFAVLRTVLTTELARVALDRRHRLEAVGGELEAARAALPAAQAESGQAREEAEQARAEARQAQAEALQAREESERLQQELHGLRAFRERVLGHRLLGPLLRVRRGLGRLRR